MNTPQVVLGGHRCDTAGDARMKCCSVEETLSDVVAFSRCRRHREDS